MPYCMRCGRELPSEATFCPNCGASAPTAALPTAPPAPQPAPVHPPSYTPARPLGVSIIAVLDIIGAIGLFILSFVVLSLGAYVGYGFFGPSILFTFGGLGLMAFGAVAFIEGWGLWNMKAWGFWLAIITGVIGIVLDIISYWSIISLISLVIGAVILIYLYSVRHLFLRQ